MINPPFLSQNRFKQNRVTTTTDPESCITSRLGKNPKTHDARVAVLLQCGWRHCDVVAALEATRTEAGVEDIDVAHTYLVECQAWSADRAQAKQRAALEARRRNARSHTC